MNFHYSYFFIYLECFIGFVLNLYRILSFCWYCFVYISFFVILIGGFIF
ncbi:putative cytochrome oxidase subunit III [Escherichia coli E22]|nr:putative cytochrome oxidase subunit III [Escherichia coli E22]